MRLLALKVVSAAGTVAVCAAASTLVAADPKPSAAPLKPPTGPAAAPPPTTTPPTTAAPTLVIPPTCNTRRLPAASALTPAEVQALLQLRDATTPAARRAILAALPADERLQVTAYVAARARCGSGTPSSEQISSSVVAGPGPGVTVTNTHVS